MPVHTRNSLWRPAPLYSNAYCKPCQINLNLQFVTMSQLNIYPNPFIASRPPSEVFCDAETESGQSGTTAFNAELDGRDAFLGQRGCVVCGITSPLKRCHIVGRSDVKAVCPMCNLTHVWKRSLHLLFSGICSNGWDGPLQVSKSCWRMKLVMD
jgi:hypothetical protein